MKNEGIDLTDIPEITNWAGGVRGKFYRKGSPAQEGQREEANEVVVDKVAHSKRGLEKD